MVVFVVVAVDGVALLSVFSFVVVVAVVDVVRGLGVVDVVRGGDRLVVVVVVVAVDVDPAVDRTVDRIGFTS